MRKRVQRKRTERKNEMKLQKLKHSADDLGEACIVTHIVNEVTLGGNNTD
jgi:hypothetical protein